VHLTLLATLAYFALIVHQRLLRLPLFLLLEGKCLVVYRFATCAILVLLSDRLLLPNKFLPLLQFTSMTLLQLRLLFLSASASALIFFSLSVAVVQYLFIFTMDVVKYVFFLFRNLARSIRWLSFYHLLLFYLLFLLSRFFPKQLILLKRLLNLPDLSIKSTHRQVIILLQKILQHS
jgi:hypothetical protein